MDGMKAMTVVELRALLDHIDDPGTEVMLECVSGPCMMHGHVTGWRFANHSTLTHPVVVITTDERDPSLVRV